MEFVGICLNKVEIFFFPIFDLIKFFFNLNSENVSDTRIKKLQLSYSAWHFKLCLFKLFTLWSIMYIYQ